MATFISDEREQRLADLEERERQAWTTYNDSLRGLEGPEYEEAEGKSWDRLQRRLKQLDDERQLVAEA